MTIRILKIFLLTFAAGLVAGCDPDASGGGGTPDAGRGDFSTFVAIGDSLTAGYADAALYRQIQRSSLPSILAQQFARVGGGEFEQPEMPGKATGSLTIAGVDLGRPDRLMLGATGDPDRPASPETIKPTETTAIDLRIAGAGGFHNLGVPGAKSFHLGLPGYGELTLLAIGINQTANPYFARFASSDATSMLADAAGLVPSFFVLWIGTNDIFLYALDGGGTNNAVPPYGTGSTDITNPALFTPSFNAAVAALKTASNTGLLINIPDVATIPYFTTVPHNPIPLSKAQADAANMAYAPYNGGLQAAFMAMAIDEDELKQRTISFEKGDKNQLVIIDESLTVVGLPLFRQATKRDYIVLPASTKIGKEATPGDPRTIWGVGMALLDSDVLTEFEYGQVEVARKAYNKTIKAAADADRDLLFFNASTMFAQLNEEGISYGSGGVTSEFGTGGAFSLDGVHPTARGYAVTANEIFKVINEGFNAYIPPVDPNKYTTVFYQ